MGGGSREKGGVQDKQDLGRVLQSGQGGSGAGDGGK